MRKIGNRGILGEQRLGLKKNAITKQEWIEMVAEDGFSHDH
jgi:hypothetical protein